MIDTGGPEAAQGKAQGGAGERELGEHLACGARAGGVAGLLLRDMQARSPQREAGEQVLVLSVLVCVEGLVRQQHLRCCWCGRVWVGKWVI